MPLKRPTYDAALPGEIARLKGLIKKVDNLERVAKASVIADAKFDQRFATPPTGNEVTSSVPPVNPSPKRKGINGANDLFNGGIANVEITKEALKIDNPVRLLLLLMPEVTPYRWQFEELMRLGGYLTTGDYEHKSEPTPDEPLKMVLAAANGSGKDMMMIAGFAVWFALTGLRNRVIITSSSFEQTKYQTEVHIRELANRANAKYGPIFRYTQFHYVCPELGSEIKLFATDEAKRAEGYHPYPGGKMALIINEAKSVTPEIFEAVARCTGYSYRLEISSPGHRSGEMYNNVTSSNTIHYPGPAKLGRYYFYRKITAYECPCIAKSHIEDMIERRGLNDPLVKSSIFAEFSDYNEPLVITEFAFDKCANSMVAPTGTDIGIGVDFGGGGDEDAIWVRRGNTIIHKFFFRLADTVAAVRLIDRELAPWKDSKYTFNADNGGIGQAFIDMLRELGWNVNRRNNQSQAFNPKEFLNLGAEMWFWTKRLIEKVAIQLPKDDKKFRLQLTTRYYKGLESSQGKTALESKAEARANGHHSPDRADGFVLCFYGYRPGGKPLDTKEAISGEKPVTPEELMAMHHRGELKRYIPPRPPGRYTLLNGKI
jgi:hypothetical protein